MDATVKQPDLLEMVKKFSELQELVPYVEKFCLKYRELFPQTDGPQVVQQDIFSPELLLGDDGEGEMRSGIGSSIIELMKRFNRPMEPIEIKKAYQKMYLPAASKEEIKKSRRNVQSSILYLVRRKKLLKQPEDGKYRVV
jgi:hypothetical protein